jgi:hypothetical protein
VKFITFSLTLFLLSLASTAQNPFSPGVIVKKNGDTLYGYLQFQTERDLTNGVRFKKDDHSDFRVFTVGEIQSFRYDKGALYKAISYVNVSGDNPKTETRFAKALVSGSYELIVLQTKSNTTLS